MSDNRGRSSLGLCHPKYDIKGLIDSFSNSSIARMSYLHRFFNPKDFSNFQKLVRGLSKPKSISIKIINGPGVNNGRTQPHEITYKENNRSLVNKIRTNDKAFLGKFEGEVKTIRGLVNVAEQSPGGVRELFISPWLEYQDLPSDAFKTLADIIRRYFPEAQIVSNPRDNRSFIPGFLREAHGDRPDPSVDLVDLDGRDWEGLDNKGPVDMIAFAKRYANCKRVDCWGLCENGNVKDGPWLPPEKRVSFPKGRDHKFYKYWMSPEALIVNSALNSSDTKGKKLQDSTDGPKQGFVWKLGEGKGYTVCLLPSFVKSFKSAKVIKNGRALDIGTSRGFYKHDPANARRLIVDFKRHPSELPDNSVLVVDGNCWILEKPQFRID